MLAFASVMIADDKTDLRSQQQLDKTLAYVLGDYATTFQGFEKFIYMDASLEPDDGATIFKPDILDEEQNGRWHKINEISPSVSVLASSPRSLDTSFIVDEDKDALVIYNVSASPALSLATGQTAVVTLEVSDDEITWTPVSRNTNGLNGTLVVGLNITAPSVGVVAAIVKRGQHLQLNTTGTTAGVTVTIVAQQESIFN